MKSLEEFINKQVNNLLIYESLENKDIDKIFSNFLQELEIDEIKLRNLLEKEGIEAKKIWHPIQLGGALMILGFQILMQRDFKNLTKFCKHFVSLSTLQNKDADK